MFTHESVVHNLWSNLRSNIKWLHSAFQRLRNEQFYLISFENVVPFLGTSDPFISFFFFDRGCKIDGFPSRGPINFPPNEFDSTSRMSQIYSCKINRSCEPWFSTPASKFGQESRRFFSFLDVFQIVVLIVSTVHSWR